MKLTALEIKQQKFNKGFRGYDEAEVNAFLTVVANDWEHMTGKIRELEQELKQTKERLKHYERVESALHETLQTAKDSATQRLESAKKEARNRIEKAESEAESLLREARQQRQQIRQSTLRLLDRREEIIRGIKSYLDMAQESLVSFSRDDANVFSLGRDEEDIMETKTPKARPSSSLTRTLTLNKEEEAPSAADNSDVDDLIDELD